jgi:hypothetical protein
MVMSGSSTTLKAFKETDMMATAAKFVQPIPILVYLVPLDVDVVPIKFH